MKICIGIATNRQIKPQTVLSLLNIVDTTKYEFCFFMATTGYTTAENRNDTVIYAQNNNCTHVLFVDDDMIFPKDTLDKLLESQKEIVGVASNKRELPLTSTVGLMKDNEYLDPETHPKWETELSETLFRCYFIGAGVMLIDMNVFKKLEAPFFKFIYNSEGRVRIGEDNYFCQLAREAGLEIWCDPTIKVGHIGDYIF